MRPAGLTAKYPTPQSEQNKNLRESISPNVRIRIGDMFFPEVFWVSSQNTAVSLSKIFPVQCTHLHRFQQMMLPDGTADHAIFFLTAAGNTFVNELGRINAALGGFSSAL